MDRTFEPDVSDAPVPAAPQTPADAARAAANIAEWRSYLPRDCVDTMIAMGVASVRVSHRRRGGADQVAISGSRPLCASAQTIPPYAEYICSTRDAKCRSLFCGSIMKLRLTENDSGSRMTESVSPSVARSIPAAGSSTLSAPLYIEWQVTNECNLTCLHCMEQSGPGKAFHDELSETQAFSFLQQVMDREIPYLSFSGGEPTLHPRFFEMVEYVCGRNAQLKIETHGHGMTVAKADRLKSLGVKAVQISLDGASHETFNRIRVRGNFDLAIEGIKNLRAAAVPVEIHYSPTLFNVHEIGLAVDLAYELGAYSFYTGRTMYAGNAVKTWQRLAPRRRTVCGVLRGTTGKSRGVSRPLASVLPRDGIPGRASLPHATSGRFDVRAPEWAGQTHRRPAVRLRRCAAPASRGDLGELKTGLGRPARG